MSILARIYREPAALMAFATALLAGLTFADLITQQGAAIALGVVAAGLGLLRYVVTPTSEVEVQRKPGLPPVAGAVSDLKTGTPVEVDVVPAGAPLAVQAEVRRIRAERKETSSDTQQTNESD